MDKTKYSVDICADSMGPALINKFESYRKALVELVMRNTRIRFVTEITEGNIDDIKELAKLSNDVRHLDGCKGNFAINEAKYLSIIVHPYSPLNYCLFLIDVVIIITGYWYNLK